MGRAYGLIDESPQMRALREHDLAVDAMFPEVPETGLPDLQPVNIEDRSANPLRPTSLEDVIGQSRVKRLLRRMIDAALTRGTPLDHVLLTGPAGTGKTTLSTLIAHELGTDCYQVEAPISTDTLLALRECASAADVLFIDEIHMQAQQDRRGRSTHMSPETLYHVLEDRRIVTPDGVLTFPEITVVGATTDVGLLPSPLRRRFPLQPRLEHYTPGDLTKIAEMNARRLGLTLADDVAAMFAKASSGFPWQVNSFMRNAASLTTDDVDGELAREVIEDLNRCTLDGLTFDQQRMLVFLLQHGRRENKRSGDVVYQAGVTTLATALGMARDVKAIQQYVEPGLIERGLLQVAPSGRVLTDKGIQRARQLEETMNGS